ncbi:outer membrane beta-barrel family protein [Hymenobacter arizonensis]|uniref:Outer membrane receptor proteins, mostly Fe transport n=1 Tax=Hymenobacter arizonensis TaxID=1227077 RepID=A0A1I6AT59_HYMAR|nr:outer membrane beta-barrel family protein [Hymenobacter arizonensis]SFQ71901.1 Outer membrane receptor proteins, mostly Fe transport [Hymenobacter arizonensis]
MANLLAISLGPSTHNAFLRRLVAALPGFLGASKGRRSALLLVSWLLPLWAAAQSTVSGQVMDATAPIAWANVVLFSPEGKLVAATTTKEDGNFALSAGNGAYKLKISFLGFADWEQDLQLEQATSLGTIVLRASATGLQEVTVLGQKQLVEYQPDRVVFKVENSVSATGGDAVGAIGAAPGVLVRNNAIGLLGKGAARVMVDGRLLELSGEELVAYLKSIPASSIKNVEVMTNPPAKYEASGDGIININLKKGLTNAWKNTATLAYEQNKYGAYALRDNLLYNKNKLRLALSAGGKRGNTNVQQTLDTRYPQGTWELRYAGKQHEDNASGQVAADYDLTPRTSVGVQYAGSYAAPTSRDYTVISIFSPRKVLDSLLVNSGIRQVSTNTHAYNAHLVSVLDTLQRKVSFDADYFAYNSKIDNDFGAETFLPLGNYLNTNLAARNISHQRVNNFSAKADVEHPLKWLSLSYGAKFSSIDSKSSIEYYNTRVENPVPDPSRSNAFEYRENTQALYVSGVRNTTEKLSAELGVRLERTQTRGYSATLNQLNSNEYLKLFPTAYAQYKHDANHSVQANYGRRVARPGFGILNPFRSYLNSTSYSEGNPFLQPSFTDNLELTYAYQAFRTNAFASRTAAGFGPVFTSFPATNTLVISRKNYFNEYAYGLGESYTATPARWWQTQTQLYVLGSKTRFVTDIQATPRNSLQLHASTSNTFTLRKSTKLQVDYSYSSPFTKGLYSVGYLSGLNLSAKQGLFHDRVQVSMLLNDVFNTNYLKDYTSTVNGVEQVYSENNSSRFFRLSLTYDFGNSQLKAAQRDFGNNDERRRTN